MPKSVLFPILDKFSLTLGREDLTLEIIRDETKYSYETEGERSTWA